MIYDVKLSLYKRNNLVNLYINKDMKNNEKRKKKKVMDSHR